MNEFSIICRILGSLFNRQPQDPLLEPLYNLIREGKLAQHWPLEQDDLLARLQQHCDIHTLAADYNALFVGTECSVPPNRSAWVEGSDEAEVRQFLTSLGMPGGEGPADSFGALLLAASWLEDQGNEDNSEALEQLFAGFIMPWHETFLGKVEAHATSVFWRTFARLSREAVNAMWEELQEEADEGDTGEER